MIFEIDEIPEGGLNLDVFVAKEQLGINQDDCSLAGDVKLKGRLDRVEREIGFSGELQTLLQVTCARCLRLFPLPVKNKIRVHFVPRLKEPSPGSEVEIKEIDIEQEVYENGRVDLKVPVRDQILLDVPLICLCQEGCRGICPVCGIDLNTKQCECRNEGEIDPRLAILKKLKDKLK